MCTYGSAVENMLTCEGQRGRLQGMLLVYNANSNI